MVKIVYMMNLESAKSHLSPPFCQVTFVTSTLWIVNMFAVLLPPPHALTKKNSHPPPPFIIEKNSAYDVNASF
jgi:hypothetical protein